MLITLIVISLVFSCINLILCVYLYKEIILLKLTSGERDILMCKLIYHVSMDIEDFETTKKIHNKMANITDLNNRIFC